MIKKIISQLTPLGKITIVAFLGIITAGLIFNLNNSSNKPLGTKSQPIVKQLGDNKYVEAIDKKAKISKDNPQAVKDQLIVEITDESAKSQFGDRLKPVKYIPNTYTLEVPGSESLAEKKKKISETNGVKSAVPNFIVFPTVKFDDGINIDEKDPEELTTMKKYQWEIDRIFVREAWKTSTGSGITVAVLDTGFRDDHIALSDSLDRANALDLSPTGEQEISEGLVTPIKCTVVKGWNVDQVGHGTGVSSLVTMNDIPNKPTGIAPDSTILPIRVSGCSGAGDSLSLVQGIHYATDKGARVINISFGLQYDATLCNDFYGKAIKYANDRNVVVVISSGNDSLGTIACPASVPGAISVGATQNEGNIRAPFSNFGQGLSIVAPGSFVSTACACNTLSGNYRYDIGATSGTSFAAPIVSGVAALMLSKNPSLTAEQVRTIIDETGQNLVGQGLPNLEYGHGLVNADAAVRRASNP